MSSGEEPSYDVLAGDDVPAEDATDADSNEQGMRTFGGGMLAFVDTETKVSHQLISSSGKWTYVYIP